MYQQSLNEFYLHQKLQHLRLLICSTVDCHSDKIAYQLGWTAIQEPIKIPLFNEYLFNTYMVRYKTRERTNFREHANLHRDEKFLYCNTTYGLVITKITLFICFTTASKTSPLNGRKTIALYFTG